MGEPALGPAGAEDGSGGAAAFDGLVRGLGGDLLEGLDGAGACLGLAEVGLCVGEGAVGGQVGLHGGVGEDAEEVDDVQLEGLGEPVEGVVCREEEVDDAGGFVGQVGKV